jgi:hypothetical protein
VKHHILVLLKVVASGQHCPVIIGELADVVGVDEASGCTALHGWAAEPSCTHVPWLELRRQQNPRAG